MPTVAESCVASLVSELGNEWRAKCDCPETEQGCKECFPCSCIFELCSPYILYGCGMFLPERVGVSASARIAFCVGPSKFSHTVYWQCIERQFEEACKVSLVHSGNLGGCSVSFAHTTVSSRRVAFAPKQEHGRFSSSTPEGSPIAVASSEE